MAQSSVDFNLVNPIVDPWWKRRAFTQGYIEDARTVLNKIQQQYVNDGNKDYSYFGELSYSSRPELTHCTTIEHALAIICDTTLPSDQIRFDVRPNSNYMGPPLLWTGVPLTHHVNIIKQAGNSGRYFGKFDDNLPWNQPRYGSVMFTLSTECLKDLNIFSLGVRQYTAELSMPFLATRKQVCTIALEGSPCVSVQRWPKNESNLPAAIPLFFQSYLTTSNKGYEYRSVRFWPHPEVVFDEPLTITQGHAQVSTVNHAVGFCVKTKKREKCFDCDNKKDFYSEYSQSVKDRTGVHTKKYSFTGVRLDDFCDVYKEILLDAIVFQASSLDPQYKIKIKNRLLWLFSAYDCMTLRQLFGKIFLDHSPFLTVTYFI